MSLKYCFHMLENGFNREKKNVKKRNFGLVWNWYKKYCNFSLKEEQSVLEQKLGEALSK